MILYFDTREYENWLIFYKKYPDIFFIDEEGNYELTKLLESDIKI